MKEITKNIYKKIKEIMLWPSKQPNYIEKHDQEHKIGKHKGG